MIRNEGDGWVGKNPRRLIMMDSPVELAIALILYRRQKMKKVTHNFSANSNIDPKPRYKDYTLHAIWGSSGIGDNIPFPHIVEMPP